ncbi:cbb3-type cytochrome c oxidase subunit 3 [Cohaesibacter gelatinilyticus]|jgi:cytochrome c oxidase cbb3-type subunit 4|uniref:Cytochrome c oxidase cbb3-type subunit 4 n=1 Tax=Cohaesibacter gelatinilyticus TaxID=372072 RepID=A0A285NBP8_9HYPH|nr:cbb3-type cytochrome c oxidase subunit 3 [Cohaesibacter gelatinilyticus]SNZ05101.1 cytochrome c oxidase cbb3-type subunit 4 [Cohaesibacter gelatinilyticus]HAT85872.1 cbb3-type cytochrome c oxidase subunit 3 [Hyphomicrobiales bacterium]
MSTYETLANFAQTWGLLYFVLIFAGVLVYALWPSNKDKFNEASHVPLRED